MAFASAITGYSKSGDKRVVYGTYTNGSGDTGGDVNTGLTVCEFITFTHKGTAVSASPVTLNETLPCSGSTVTIVTDDGVDGYWKAEGY